MKKLLIIEDDQIVANIYLRKFQIEGFQVELALDGEAGLASTLKSRPDIVILDLMLPRLNGVEVLKKLRAEPITRDLPVVVLSNAYMSSLVQDAWKAGANYCMIKANCTPRQLVDIVNKTIGAALPAPPAPIATSPPEAALADPVASAPAATSDTTHAGAHDRFSVRIARTGQHTGPGQSSPAEHHARGRRTHIAPGRDLRSGKGPLEMRQHGRPERRVEYAFRKPVQPHLSRCRYARHDRL